MENVSRLPQLLLRFALGITFLTPVADRLGLLGPLGTGNVEWGNWTNFINYTTLLMPFLERPMVNVMGGMATVAELLIGVLLIAGFKTKYAALGSCVLTLIFIVAMTTFIGIQKPVNFGVFTCCTASFLLSQIPAYQWSVDDYLRKKSS